MTFLLRQIDQTATGREIVRERTVEGARLTIGRAAENALALPDLAIEPHHLQVDLTGEGDLAFEALGTLGFLLDGRSTTAASARGRAAELVLGSYRLDFAADAGGGTLVTVRQREEREGQRGEGLHGFGLGRALPGKRVLSWTLLTAILLAFLAIPIWSHVERERVPADIDRPGSVMLDASWSPGALSKAHHGLEDNCEACHAQAFVAVRDGTCLACHKNIGDHAAPRRQALARGPMSFGDGLQRKVADVFHKPGPGACTDCHTEHEGAGRMPATRQKFCADCHGTLDARLTDAKIGDADDFGTLHPQFQATIFITADSKEPRRVSLADHPKEANGLRFPHATHLDPRGGVTRMALRLGTGRGYGAPLDCASCHRRSADGISFQPIEMTRDCESCHALSTGRVGATFRTLRHTSAKQSRAGFVDPAKIPRGPVMAARKRPGEFARGGLYYGNFGAPTLAAGPTSRRALVAGGVCGECHFPGGAGAGVAEVRQSARYFVHGWFDHAAHRQEKCTTCHAAGKSQAASDLLLPDLKSCRTCHQGEDARATKVVVPSGCAMCHSYHPTKGAPRGGELEKSQGRLATRSRAKPEGSEPVRGDG